MSSREITELRSRVKSQMEIIDALKLENKLLKNGQYTNELQRLQRKLEQMKSELEGRPRSRSLSSLSLPEDIKKRLVMLCHPDRHNNSEMSNKVLQWLNSL